MNGQSDDSIREKTLLDDIFDTLDSGNSLDGVFTDKTVIMNFISYPEIMDPSDIVNPQPFIFVFVEIFSLLAHVFKKFPSMWKMNWMFVKKRSGPRKGERFHRLEFALPELSRRSREYFMSQAFYDDFIYAYFDRHTRRLCK